MIHLFNHQEVVKIKEEKAALARFCKILFGPTPDPYLLDKVESLGAANRKAVLELLAKALDKVLASYKKHVEGIDLGKIPADLRPACMDCSILIRSMAHSPHVNHNNTVNDIATLHGVLETWEQISPLLPREYARLPALDLPEFQP